MKIYYLQRTYRKLITETDDEDRLTVPEFWKAFNILDCILTIGSTWDKVFTAFMNSA